MLNSVEGEAGIHSNRNVCLYAIYLKMNKLQFASSVSDKLTTFIMEI